MTFIDRDELLKHEVMIITKGNAAFHGVPSSLIETAPAVDPASRLNWHTGKPPEHESMFAKFKGTKKWLPGMFETVSNEVLVTIELPDKTRIVTVSKTTDGKWTGCCKNFECEVVAWTEMPAPAKEGVA